MQAFAAHGSPVMKISSERHPTPHSANESRWPLPPTVVCVLIVSVALTVFRSNEHAMSNWKRYQAEIAARGDSVISLVLMLATASLGWLTIKDQVAPPRIKDVRGSGGNPVSGQDVVARLWEDPLLAVQAEVARYKDTNSSLTHGPDAFKRLASRKLEEGKRVCQLVVPIPGSSFPDDGEWRLRLRYSLEVALAQSRGHLDLQRRAGGHLLVAVAPGRRQSEA